MQKLWLLLGTAFTLVQCTPLELEEHASTSTYTSLVNPMIGTGGHGHTFPGASLPFGMMQLSPDTRLQGWDGCSGYHYSDSVIFGFSHTHLSGTGVSDYGDVLLMPTQKVEFNNGADGTPGYGSAFSHTREIADPGYYRVQLDETEIQVELTVSERSGIHRYTYPENSAQVIILDLEHRDPVGDARVEVDGRRRVYGHRFSKAWAKDQRVFFDLEFSKPYSEVHYYRDTIGEYPLKAAFEFDSKTGNSVEVRIGISAVDVDGARRNREEELRNMSFEEVRWRADSIWEKQLGKIEVETHQPEDLTIFYTALYHTLLAPNLFHDVDGRYRGMDQQLYRDTTFSYYTVFSLWDTYRATHPLFTLIEQERTLDFVKTLLSKYREGGILPIWDLWSNYTGCMIGYHAVPVIADAYLKGIRGFDAEEAFESMKHSAMQDHLGLDEYKTRGYIPVEKEPESVSKTLEYAYDDWTLAQMAQSLGKTEDYAYFLKRAQSYKNVFDPSTGFMRGRFRNQWYSPFDPYEVNFNYTEANAWQYSFYVPQDVSGHIGLMGGKAAYKRMLDRLFNAKPETSGREQQDISGLIGQYAHGNEPSHHMAYLYNFINEPFESQAKIRQILKEQYRNSPDGISGNEDCGQMSAWYVFSALGFYPVTPGSNEYILGSPLVKKAKIHLENGRVFEIRAPESNEANVYVGGVLLNGAEHRKSAISHESIAQGGVLEFQMQSEVSDWATRNADVPETAITEHLITPVPYIKSGEIAFLDSTEVQLACPDSLATIYYSTGGIFTPYEHPLIISKNTELTIYSASNFMESAPFTTEFRQRDPRLKIALESSYSSTYAAGGNNALIDGILGSEDFRTGTWQGYYDTDFGATVYLGEARTVNRVKIRFLSDQSPWIFYPKSVTCYASLDGDHFTYIGREELPVEAIENSEIKTLDFNLGGRPYAYVKVVAEKVGTLPPWHLGASYNGRAWMFVDEIQIE